MGGWGGILLPAALVGIVLVGVPVVTALLAQRDLTQARGRLLQARAFLRSMDLADTGTAPNQASPPLQAADRLLSSPLTWAGRMLPAIRSNLQVASALDKSGQALVAAGHQGVAVLEAPRIQPGHPLALVHNGAVDLKPFSQAAQPVAALDREVIRAQHLAATSPTFLLFPQVRATRSQALAEAAFPEV